MPICGPKREQPKLSHFLNLEGEAIRKLVLYKRVMLFLRILAMLSMALGTAICFPSDSTNQTSTKDLSAGIDLNDTTIEYEAYDDEDYVNVTRPRLPFRPLAFRPSVIDPKPLKQVKRTKLSAYLHKIGIAIFLPIPRAKAYQMLFIIS